MLPVMMLYITGGTATFICSIAKTHKMMKTKPGNQNHKQAKNKFQDLK